MTRKQKLIEALICAESWNESLIEAYRNPDYKHGHGSEFIDTKYVRRLQRENTSWTRLRKELGSGEFKL